MKKARRFRSESPPPLRPRGRAPYRTILMIFLLTIIGFVFLGSAYSRHSKLTTGELTGFYVLASLLLIPGLYHLFILIRIWIGTPGFTYEMLPNFSED